MEQRIRAAAQAMSELEGIGQRFAALDLAEKFFGPELAERLRTGKVTAAEFVESLEEASRKEVLKQEQVTRALELDRAISDVKGEISAALAVTFDFSNAAMALNGVWLTVLKTTRDVVQTMNTALTIPPPAGPSQNQYDGLLQSQAKFVDLLEKADAAASRGLPHAAEKAEEYRRKLANVNDELGKVRIAIEPEYRRENNRATALSAMPDPTAPIGSRTTTEMFGPAIPKPEPKPAAAAAPSADTMTAMDRYIRDVEKARDVAKAEYNTIGLSNTAREEALALAKAQSAAQTDYQRGLRDSVALTGDETDRIIAAADATAKWKDEAKQLQDAISFSSDATKDFAKGFVHDLREGKTAAEALANALDKLATKLMDKALDSAVDGLFGKNTGGGIGGLIAQFMGKSGNGGDNSGYQDATYDDFSGYQNATYASGGYTGQGGKHEPAGIVHREEYVFDAASTRRIGVANLDAMRRTMPGYFNGGYVDPPRRPMRGYAEGGLVGAAPSTMMAPRAAPTMGAPNVVIHNNGQPVDAQANVSHDANGTPRIDIILDAVENHLAQKAGRGRGSLFKASSAAATGRNMRG